MGRRVGLYGPTGGSCLSVTKKESFGSSIPLISEDLAEKRRGKVNGVEKRQNG
jgi:hypothetical protein